MDLRSGEVHDHVAGEDVTLRADAEEVITSRRGGKMSNNEARGARVVKRGVARKGKRREEVAAQTEHLMGRPPPRVRAGAWSRRSRLPLRSS